jgi:hypothetical protein
MLTICKLYVSQAPVLPYCMTLLIACLQAGGACAFGAAMCGWYLFYALMLASVNFPIQLPVGDLSNIYRFFRKNEVMEGESPV